MFCRVIDNHGDLGVAWRLCADLAARGERVRLWVDDAAALAWMAPQGHAGVEVVAWTEPAPDLEPGDVVVEAFGCDPPAGLRAPHGGARNAAGLDQPRVPERRSLRRAQPRPALAGRRAGPGC